MLSIAEALRMRGIVWQVVRCVVAMGVIVGLDYALLTANLRYTRPYEAVWCVVMLAVQMGMASVWFAIGRDQFFARLLVWLMALCSGWLFLRAWHELAEQELTPCFAVQAAGVTCTLLLLRVLRFRTIRVSNEPTAGPTAFLPQFSIVGVLLWTGLIGVVFAVVLRMQSLRVPTHATAISCIVGAFLASLTLAAVLATLTFRNPLAFAPLVCVGSALLGFGVGLAVNYFDPVVAIVALAVPASGQSVALLAARMAGYRFVRAGSASPQACRSIAILP
jgi:hypothetical protein